ncbi:metallophosphoesterase [Arthrobacter sp. H41]|uniref:metallophosphoesterase n=1 Tax=Arthrobacter sp. H41 TaxID=1312978 RepID=UPI00138B05B7|nr:metallophosphoesterase [Arthrobacter sp. H41]
MVERIVDRAVEEDPEAVLIAGDFLYSNDPGNQEKIDTVLDLLAPITDAGIPSYAVLGNHDHIVGAAEELTTALESRGVTVLLNESAEVPLPDGNPAPPLHVVGLGPAYQGLADSEKAFSGIPASDARIVMMHNPDTFPTLPPDSAPLAVAGHTHCGQIAVPGTPDWSWLALTTDEPAVADGFAPKNYGAEGNQLYVTCGIGFSDIPVRIGAPPQIVFFELSNGTGQELPERVSRVG